MVNFGLTAAFVINRAEQRHAIIAAAKKNKFFDTKMTDAEDEEDINKVYYWLRRL